VRRVLGIGDGRVQRFEVTRCKGDESDEVTGDEVTC
jgi:hypothetical protein